MTTYWGRTGRAAALHSGVHPAPGYLPRPGLKVMTPAGWSSPHLVVIASGRCLTCGHDHETTS